ncbi:Chromosome partitioning ATPase, Mrp family, contains Fe-S cluster [Lentzea xinjiangensis]|uniref:Chromosome partitioning ATPase, Mrp family, contains Fe-S cluster n=1 Tax=Lentzea xinjiangensis TaxID=402600 RepID=A0A1H9RDD9_9PSEU|nr:tetratricopeptide repeat protein [Lentzea xinjiangensis]SER70736.1 Chromosome partitioning ATPase, Mrp family, contains Fe-S cluster [Lentzea xinjiangensis]
MIVTFYSYKGGVGRSFCLANVAVQLARWGNRVLCVDFDLDAPGLHEYFSPYADAPVRGGLVEVIAGEADWTEVVEPVFVPDAESLSLLAAGAMTPSYADRAQTLSWPELFADHDLGWRFEKIREEWAEHFDYVLVDSRTGITDIGGICTAQLPDVLVLCVAPNRQNLAGALEVARRASDARDKLPYDRAGLLYLPVVSRFDGKEEYERARSWRTAMAEQFGPLYASWLPADQHDDQPELGLVERTTVPYLPYWSFGEEIAVVDERSGSPDSVSYYMDNIAALLAHRLADADVLVSNRDTYVSAARERGRREAGQGFRYDVLVHGTSERAVRLTDELLALGVRAVRGRLAELSMVRHFVVVDPPARPSAGVQEILDQVQLDSGRLVMVVGEAPKQLAAAHPLRNADAVEVVSALPVDDARPDWADVLVAAARRLQERGDLAGAHALVTRTVQASNTPTKSLLLRGEVAMRLGRLDEAERDLLVAVSHPGEAPRAHRLLGEVYRDMGDLFLAAEHFQEALDAGADEHEQALVHRELATMELRAGRPSEALRHLATARELSSGDDVLAAKLGFELGSLLVDQGDLEEAGRQLAEAVEQNTLLPGDQVSALSQLAYLDTAAGRYRRAEEHFLRALDLAEGSVEKADIIIALARMQVQAFGLSHAIHTLSAALASLDQREAGIEARLHEAVGALRVDNGEAVLAGDPYRAALKSYRRLGDRAGEVRALIGLAASAHDAESAIGIGEEARRLLARLRGPEADLLRRQLDSVAPK